MSVRYLQQGIEELQRCLWEQMNM